MLRVENQFAQKSDQTKTSLKTLLSVLFWIITWFWWQVMLSILNNKDTSLSTFLDHHLVLVKSNVVHSEQWEGWRCESQAVHAPVQTLKIFVSLFFFLQIWTWGCVVVPCFCSKDIVRKLPSPEIIIQTPNHQKHDNESNATCLGNPS